MSDTRNPAWSRYSTRKHPKAPEGKPAWAGGGKSKGAPKAKPSPSPYRMTEAPDAGLHRMLNNRQRAKRSAEADNGAPCPNCGKKHDRPNAKYCSPECREAFWQSVAPGTLPFIKGYRKGKSRGKSEALLEMIERKRALGHDREDDF